MRTIKDAIKYLKSMEGKAWNPDHTYGFQCFDVANQWWLYLFGHTLKGVGAADIPTWNNFDGEATVYKNSPSFLAQPGDVVIFNRSYGEGYGHVGIVLSATLNSMQILEQNWLGGAYWTPPEVTTRRTHGYDAEMWFVRPFYAKGTVIDKIKSKTTPVKKAKTNKGKRIMLVAGHGYNDPGATGYGTNERDFIRKNIVPNVAKYLKQVGHTVAIYGGSKQDQDMYQDTKYGQQVGNYQDYGLYWVKKQKYDIVIEFHLDSAGASAQGGHVIIPSAFPPDSIDKGLQNALKGTVGTIRGVTPRTDLMHCNVANKININYRLIELGFITSKHDMDYITKHLQAFTKRLAEGINGRQINQPASKKAKVQTKWVWKGRFTPNITIKVRTSPSLKGKVISNNVKSFTKVKTIKFNFIVKAEGYWWISYTSKGKTYYSAICKITDKKERVKHERYWGKLSWGW